jgi:hypothetical protein
MLLCTLMCPSMCFDLFSNEDKIMFTVLYDLNS